jgi:hypothetical protein
MLMMGLLLLVFVSNPVAENGSVYVCTGWVGTGDVPRANWQLQ